MKRMTLILFITIVGLGLTGGLMQLGAAKTANLYAATAACSGDNLLTNPGFEGEYSTYHMPPPGHPDCQTWNPDEPNEVCERAQMPAGWHPYWRDDPRPETWINIMPEYTQSTTDQINPDRVRSGEKSLHYWSFWSTHEGGVYQQVAATPGGQYCFSVYGHAWSARTDGDWYSDPDPDNGELFQKVGIDPTGGTDWQSGDIIWSDEKEQYDLFELFQVEAVAQAEKFTVFLYSRPNAPVKHNDVYWDDAALTVATMDVAASGLGILADDDIPQTTTYAVAIDLSPGLTWTASLDPMSAITPTLSAASGQAGENLAVTLSSSGYPTGTYTTTLTIASSAGVLGSPVTVPITLWVVPEVNYVFLPAVSKP